jgi:hypothetical protein
VSGRGLGRAAGLAALALLPACGQRLPAAPGALPRLERVEPSGTGVAPALAEASATFSAPVSPEGLVDGRRMVLVPAAAQRDAVAAVESEEGASGLAGAVPGRIELSDGGKRAALVLSAPLHPLASYVLVIGSKVRAADGREVLDAEGRPRATASPFQTGPAAGPPARPVIAEIRVDAEAPEAGGEYLVLQNRGEGTLDLFGHRLEKQREGGSVTSCVLGEGEVRRWGLALVVGGAYDQRYALPDGTVVVQCGSSALLSGLANDRFPRLRLLDPTGAELSTAGVAGGPVCAIALRIDLDGPDAPDNWECIESD